MTYNLTFVSNTTTLSGIFVGINDNSGGWFAGLMLLSFFILFFMVFKNYDTKTVFLAGSFLTSVIAGLLWFAEVTELWVVGVCIGFFVVTAIIKLWGDL